MTYIICYDDHRSFTDEVKKRFSDNTRYTVESFHSSDDFVERMKRERESRSCRVAIIGVPDAAEHHAGISEMTSEIKKNDPLAGIILLSHADRLEDIKKAVRFNIDSYVPRNSNAVLRIHNTVKRIISERNISTFRKRRNFSLYVLMGFILLMVLLVIIARFRLPHYF